METAKSPIEAPRSKRISKTHKKKKKTVTPKPSKLVQKCKNCFLTTKAKRAIRRSSSSVLSAQCSAASPPPRLMTNLPWLAARTCRYLSSAIDSLPAGFAALDAAQPWLAYWSLHALDLLGALDAPLHLVEAGYAALAVP